LKGHQPTWIRDAPRFMELLMIEAQAASCAALQFEMRQKQSQRAIALCVPVVKTAFHMSH